MSIADDFKANTNWFREHGSDYKGQWVALLRGELLDSDPSRLDLQERINIHPEVSNIFVILSSPGGLDLTKDHQDTWEAIRVEVAYSGRLDRLGYFLGEKVSTLNKQTFLQSVAARISKEPEAHLKRFSHLLSKVENSYDWFFTRYSFGRIDEDPSQGSLYLSYAEALMALGSAKVMDIRDPGSPIFRRQLLRHLTDMVERMPEDSPRRHYLYSQAKARLG